MVTSVTSLGRSGLHDWIIQRISAVVMAAYVIFLVGFILGSESVTFEVWSALFSQTWFKIFSFISIVSLSFHAWIGVWIITTDYIKALAARMIVQVFVILSCFAFVVWGAQIIWSL